jgi:hypothetical protein
LPVESIDAGTTTVLAGRVVGVVTGVVRGVVRGVVPVGPDPLGSVVDECPDPDLLLDDPLHAVPNTPSVVTSPTTSQKSLQRGSRCVDS